MYQRHDDDPIGDNRRFHHLLSNKRINFSTLLGFIESSHHTYRGDRRRKLYLNQLCIGRKEGKGNIYFQYTGQGFSADDAMNALIKHLRNTGWDIVDDRKKR